jgi:hypothetical protein
MNKTIEINPSLFSIGSLSKTKKNRGTTNIKKTNTPLISPNVLKNKLLKRIKEHKLREIKTLETNNKTTNTNTNKNDTKPKLVESYTNEFNESLSYLQNLSMQEKIKKDKINHEKSKADLERKTVKNYHSLSQNINIDLPDELKETHIFFNKEQSYDNANNANNANSNNANNANSNNANNANSNNANINTFNIKDDVPYGILKGGTKPTFRAWNKTHKNIGSNSNIVFSDTVNKVNTNTNTNGNENAIINNEISEREKRLNELKEKIKQKEVKYFENGENGENSDVWMNKNLIQKTSNDLNIIPITRTDNLISNGITNNITDNIIDNNVNNISNINNEVLTKKIIHKTIRRSYTLGKSKIKKSVAVLLKDRKTRKNIISAHKDLKRKQIHDIKNYLREHNLMKIGSDAPNDVIRKIYEHAMMSGEITNINRDTMLQNFLQENK